MARIRGTYRKAFDTCGLEEVRRLAVASATPDEMRSAALLYIEEKDAERQRASLMRRMAAQARLAQSAKNAAWIAAVCAGIAALAAIITLFI